MIINLRKFTVINNKNVDLIQTSTGFFYKLINLYKKTLLTLFLQYFLL